MQPETDWIRPPWELPGVRAFCSTRAGNFNQPPFGGFNTANHVGDCPESVAQTRAWLSQYFHWSAQPQWLKQVHGTTVVEAKPDAVEREADAVFSRHCGIVCTLHTADCLPVFFAAKNGTEVALAHAGWRGLAAGVLQATLAQLNTAPRDLSVWIGPAISAAHFEVGEDVLRAFDNNVSDTKRYFSPNERGRWQCDLAGIAHSLLQECGVQSISGGNLCSYTDERFFSYRRNNRTGRTLSLIWIDPAQ